MPKTYIRKGIKNQWTDVQMTAAKKAVQSGELSIGRAAVKFGIPKSTLGDHVKGTSSKRYGGPRTILSAAEEKEIVTDCMVLQELGFPLTRDLVSITVRDFLKDQERDNPFKDGIPGYDWWNRFLRRHPTLSERTPEHLQHQRARAATPEVKKKYTFNTQ